MKKVNLPNFLQPFLWSVKISELDLEKNKVYIIHQILAFGNIESIKWLFRTYSSKEIKRVFLNHSCKIYRDSAFNFITKILLGINKNLNVKKYVVDSF